LDANGAAYSPKKHIKDRLIESVIRIKEVKWREIGETIAVLSGIFLCWVYWHQLDVMQKQLIEMQGSGPQNSQLIANAAHQAKATSDLAVAAKWTARAAETQALQPLSNPK